MEDDNKIVAAYATLDKRPGGASSDTVYGIVGSANGTVEVDGDTYTSWSVQVDDNRDNDKTVLIAGDSDELAEGYLVSFDVTSDNVYTTNDIDIYLKNAPENVDTSKAYAVAVNEYDDADQIITYWTSNKDIGTIDAGSYKTSAVDDDVKVVYVDSEDNEGAASNGSYTYDSVKMTKNAVVVLDGSKVIAIFFDVDGDITK